MYNSNIINNINIEELPESVIEAIHIEFNDLCVQEKLIVYARLIHGNLFKSERSDLIGVNRLSVAKVYDRFIKKLQLRLIED